MSKTVLVNGLELTVPDDDSAVVRPVLAQSELHAVIDAERARRLDAGASFAVTGITNPISLTGRAFDQTIYLALLARAQQAQLAGVLTASLRIRAGDDVIHLLTAAQMIELIAASMDWVEMVMATSWAMKDLTDGTSEGLPDFSGGVPADIADDQWWPT